MKHGRYNKQSAKVDFHDRRRQNLNMEEAIKDLEELAHVNIALKNQLFLF